MKLQKLFKIASTGAQQEWEISTKDNVIVTRWGKVGGKIQETQDVIKEGKNAGRSNATTPTEQAEAEATATWEQKLKKGYVKSLAGAVAGEIDESIEGGILPMLAKKFSEDGHKIIYPCFTQPKFDGHRCIAILDKESKCTLWSRTRKIITGLPHINEAIEESIIWDDSVPEFLRHDILLDGELYNHEYHDKFEELTSFIRNPTPKEGHEVVEFHIYDIADNDKTFRNRHELIQSYKLKKPLVPVETIEVTDEDDLMVEFERFLSMGYEGSMVRNSAGLYVNKRSVDLQKIKEFDEAEYKIIGVKEGRGKLAGKAIFLCETGKGAGQFEVKLKGPQADLAKYWKDPSLAIGRMLTVQYQGITNKNNVPRFPVGLRFREDV